MFFHLRASLKKLYESRTRTPKRPAAHVPTLHGILATKHDLQELKVDLTKWMVGTQLAYGSIVVAVLVALL